MSPTKGNNIITHVRKGAQKRHPELNREQSLRETHLTGCVENFEDAWHSLVVNNLLVSVFDGGVILKRNNRTKGGQQVKKEEGVFVYGGATVPLQVESSAWLLIERQSLRSIV